MNIRNFKIKYMFIILSCFLLVGNLGIKEARAEALDSDIVTFPDSNLEAAVRSKLKKPTGIITVGDMRGMTGELWARDKEIKSLKGLENAVGIEELILDGNQINDVTPLKDLTNLTYLDLSYNQISDISQLENLIELRFLDLSDNQINVIPSLKNMVNLTELELQRNNISDITGLTGMTSLLELHLGGNSVKDITPLENMTKLVWLQLSENEISIITPLKDMVNLEILDLGYNLISDITPLKNLANLNRLILDGNKIKDISIVNNMSNLKGLSLSNAEIDDITVLKDINWLTMLSLNENRIKDLAPISNMTNMEYLYLDGNQIEDISPLSKMTNLNMLHLCDNQISDISVFRNMTNVGYLYLNSNEISDITPLSYVKNVEYLYLNDNEISDITPLSNIVNLWYLDLDNNQITYIPTLKSASELYGLSLKDNKIEFIPEFIGNFTKLEYLDLRNNNLTGSIPECLNNLTNLKYWNGDNDPETAWYTSFSGNYLTGNVPAGLKSKLDPAPFYNNLLEGESNQKQLTLLPGAELNLSLNSIPTQNTLKSITKLFDGETQESKSIYELELVPTDPSFFDASGKTIKSGATTAYIKLKGVSDTNAYAKTAEAVPIVISDKIGSNNDINLNFSIDNSLEVTLGSNTVNFGEVSSLGGEVESTTLTVTSSLPYDISTMAYDDFVGSLDSASIIPIDKISLDIDALGYKALTKNKTLNIGDSPSAINKIHNLNLKMGNTLGYKKDDYNTSIQFIVDAK